MKRCRLPVGALLIAVALWIAACAEVPLALPDTDATVKAMVPPPDKGLLYVYRESLILLSEGATITPQLDGMVLGELASDTYLVAVVEPGTHLYSTPVESLPFRVEAGKSYFVKASPLSKDRFVDEGEARKALAGCRLIYGSKEPMVLGSALARQTTAPAAPAPTASPAPVSDVDTAPAPAGPRQGKAYAVVVGIERYRQNLPTAPFARRDAETIAAYLTQTLGYPEEQVVSLVDEHAAKSDFEKYFEKWLPNHVEAGGTVFVYFSGHGAPNPQTGDAYLVPYDGDPAFLDQTGYPLKRLYAALGKLPARSVVVALDACFSGAGGRSVIAPGTRSIGLNLKAQTPLPGNMTVLAASSGEQTSSTYAEKGHGLFTYYLLKGIREEGVVAPDGTLRLDDLFAYLKPQVERVARRQYNNEQTPQLIGAGHE